MERGKVTLQRIGAPTEADWADVADSAGALEDGYDVHCLMRDVQGGGASLYAVMVNFKGRILKIATIATYLQQCGTKTELAVVGAPRPERLRAGRVRFKDVMEAINRLADSMGTYYVVANSNHPAVLTRLRQAGYIETHRTMKKRIRT